MPQRSWPQSTAWFAKSPVVGQVLLEEVFHRHPVNSSPVQFITILQILSLETTRRPVVFRLQNFLFNQKKAADSRFNTRLKLESGNAHLVPKLLHAWISFPLLKRRNNNGLNTRITGLLGRPPSRRCELLVLGSVCHEALTVND